MTAYGTVAATILAILWLLQYVYHMNASPGLNLRLNVIVAVAAIGVAMLWPVALIAGLCVHVWCAYLRDRLGRTWT